MDVKTRVNIYVETWIAERFRKDQYLQRHMSKIVNELLGDYLHGEGIKSIKREITEYEHKINELEVKKLGAKHRIKDLQLAEKKKIIQIKEKDEFMNEIAKKFKSGQRTKIDREINKDWVEGYVKDVKKNGWEIKEDVLIDYCIAFSTDPYLTYSTWR